MTIKDPVALLQPNYLIIFSNHQQHKGSLTWSNANKTLYMTVNEQVLATAHFPFL